MYRKKLMRVCLTGVMVVSIATANVAPVFAAEPVEKVETESDSLGRTKRVLFYRNRFHQYSGEKNGRSGGASRNSGSSRTADCRKRQKRKNLGVSGGSEYLYVTSFASGDRTGQSTHVDSGYGICGCNGASGMYGSGCTD